MTFKMFSYQIKMDTKKSQKLALISNMLIRLQKVLTKKLLK
jgi:hypothetical protein